MKLSVFKYSSCRKTGGGRTSDGYRYSYSRDEYITVYSDSNSIYKSALTIIQSFISKNLHSYEDDDCYYEREYSDNKFYPELTHELACLLIEGVDEIDEIEEVEISLPSSIFYLIPSKEIEIINDQNSDYAETQQILINKQGSFKREFRFKIIEKTRDCNLNKENSLLENCYPLDVAFYYKDQRLFDSLIKRKATAIEQFYPMLMWQCQSDKGDNIIYFYNESTALFDEEILMLLMRSAMLRQNYELVFFLSDKVNIIENYEYINFAGGKILSYNGDDNYYSIHDGVSYQKKYSDLKPKNGLNESVIINAAKWKWKGREIFNCISLSFKIGDEKLFNILLEEGNPDIIIREIKHNNSMYCALLMSKQNFFCSLLEKCIISISNDYELNSIICNKYYEISSFLTRNQHFLNKCIFLRDNKKAMYLMRNAILYSNYEFLSLLSNKVDYTKYYRCYGIYCDETSEYFCSGEDWAKGKDFDSISLSLLKGDTKAIDILIEAGADIHKIDYLSFLIHYKKPWYDSLTNDGTKIANNDKMDFCACYLLEKGLVIKYDYSTLTSIIGIVKLI
ncbi:hypothetical protein EZS27_019616 [termite gut metagenome]|uniref:Ankyrin repeat protein n=1 Tax=termite gut metagenome TaxID=433724 RepID=A0A5J4RG03_9ZZZZ